MSPTVFTRKPKKALVKFEDKTRSIIKTTLLRPQGGIHRHAELTALWDGQWLKCTVLELHDDVTVLSAKDKPDMPTPAQPGKRKPTSEPKQPKAKRAKMVKKAAVEKRVCAGTPVIPPLTASSSLTASLLLSSPPSLALSRPASPTPPPSPVPRLPSTVSVGTSPPRYTETSTSTSPPTRADAATNTSPSMELNSGHGTLKELVKNCRCVNRQWTTADNPRPVPVPSAPESPVGPPEVIEIPGVEPLPPSPPRLVSPAVHVTPQPLPNILLDFTASKLTPRDITRHELETLKLRVPSMPNFLSKLVEMCVPTEIRRVSNTRGVKGKRQLDPNLMASVRHATFELYGIPTARTRSRTMLESLCQGR